MTLLMKLNVVWAGLPGGPGLSTFYAGAASTTAYGAIRALFLTLQNNTPQSVTYQFPASGFIIESSTGVQTGTWSTTASSNLQGTDVNPYSAATGAVINWRTASLNARGHTIQGRTFLVPIIGSMYQTDGSLNNSYVSGLITNATTMINTTPGDFRVWSRPTTPGGSDGTAAPITSVRVTDRVQVLRRRRS